MIVVVVAVVIVVMWVVVVVVVANHRLRGLRRELSSPALTLISWVRIPPETLMFVYVYSVFVLSCV
jgi:hypothetical protein